jgi:PAS domain S-box-containing protein
MSPSQTGRMPSSSDRSDLHWLAENASDIIARFDRELRHLYVNPAVELATGRPAADFIGKTNEELGMPAEQCAVWRGVLLRVFETGEPGRLEFHFDTPRGRRHFETRVIPEREPGGGVASILMISRDVTDSRTTQLLEAALRHLPAGVALVEAPSGRPLFKNEEADRIFGRSPGAFTLQQVADYKAYTGFRPDGTEYGPADWPLSRSIATGESIAAEEAEIVRADGSRGFISMTSSPVRDASGAIVAGLVTYYDITATRGLEGEVAAVHRETALLYRLSDAANRAETLESVFEAALDTIVEILQVDRASILLFDPDGVMRFKASRGLSEDYRRAVEGHSPWSRDEKDPSPILVGDVDADAEMRPYRDLFRREGIGALGFVPLVYGGRLVGKFMVYRNAPRPFSERHAALAQTVAAQIASAVGRSIAEKSLLDANRRKDEFLAMLSHELRNPLAATRSALTLLRETSPNADQARRFTEVIERQTSNLVRIVDDLLDVSRVTRGLIELKNETVDAGALLSRSLDAVRSEIDSKRHVVAVTIPHKPVYVVGDPVRLEQVIVNLAGNAVKYTDAGGRISVVLEATEDEAVFRVRDSGVGFEASMAERIFDLFQQAPTGLDRAQGGLGIGLTIVKSLVELHGGWIRAHSDGPGQGSEFSFSLPLARPDARPALVERRLHALAPNARSVLVIDDHEDSGEMLVALLEGWGHLARLAPDGVSGIRLAEELSPDLVLADIGLPGLDGFEVARRLRANPRTAGSLLVAVTGYGQESDRARAIEAGFSHHLVKPVNPEALLAILADVPGARSQLAGNRD